MKIINRVTDENYTQWIEGFTSKVFKRARVKYNEIIIDDIEPSKRIFTLVDGDAYTIRTWGYYVVKYDINGIPCAENVDYTLYKMVRDDNGSHGEIVDEGRIKIEWTNDM